MYVDTLSSTITWCFSIAMKEFSIATSKRVFFRGQTPSPPQDDFQNIPPLSSSHDPSWSLQYWSDRDFSRKHGILEWREDITVT